MCFPIFFTHLPAQIDLSVAFKIRFSINLPPGVTDHVFRLKTMNYTRDAFNLDKSTVKLKHFGKLCNNSCSVTILSNSFYVFSKRTPLLQVVGVSERRLVRRAGVLLVVTIMMIAMMLMEQNDPVIASETNVLKGLIVRTTLC